RHSLSAIHSPPFTIRHSLSAIHFRHSLPPFTSAIHFRHSLPPFTSAIHFRHSLPPFTLRHSLSSGVEFSPAKFLDNAFFPCYNVFQSR
ncbi:MAG: hypothetical protein IJF17_02515, partial [Thermoguttaceae bacterium]|nr:hypothetical protein [Thermoguttaceae bacterium]